MKIKVIKINRIFSQKIKIKSIIEFAEILCFFELFTISRMEVEGIAYPLPTLMLKAFAFGRLIISAYEIFVFIKNHGRRYSQISYGITFFCLSLLLAPLITRYMIVSTLIAVWTYIGFVLFCDRILRKDPDSFLGVLVFFFGAISIIDLIGVILFPPNALGDYSFAGGKNAAFDYNLIFLFLLLKIKEVGKWKLMILTLLFFVGGIIRNSANTIICLGILFVFLFLINGKRMPRRKSGSKWVVPAIIVIEIFILSTTIFARSSRLLISLMNYDIKFMTFSGRTYQWEQALYAFIKQPFGGGMIGTTYKVPTFTGFIEYSHPHNKFLGILASNGIIAILVLIGLLFFITWKSKGKTYSNSEYVDGIFLFCFLMHMLFDDTSYFRFFIVLILYCYKHGAYILNSIKEKPKSEDDKFY